MIDVYTMNLENGQKYIILDTIVKNNNNYLIFVNDNNDKDLRIRKVIMENNQEMVVKLDSDEEVKDILNEFYNKHKGEN